MCANSASILGVEYLVWSIYFHCYVRIKYYKGGLRPAAKKDMSLLPLGSPPSARRRASRGAMASMLKNMWRRKALYVRALEWRIDNVKLAGGPHVTNKTNVLKAEEEEADSMPWLKKVYAALSVFPSFSTIPHFWPVSVPYCHLRTFTILRIAAALRKKVCFQFLYLLVFCETRLRERPRIMIWRVRKRYQTLQARLMGVLCVSGETYGVVPSVEKH